MAKLYDHTVAGIAFIGFPGFAFAVHHGLPFDRSLLISVIAGLLWGVSMSGFTYRRG